MSSTLSVYLCGEAALVREWGEVCVQHGMNVRYTACGTFDAVLPTQMTEVREIPSDLTMALELTNIDRLAKRENLVRLDATLPPSVPILTSSVAVSTTEQAAWLRQSSRVVGISAMPSLLRGTLVEVAPHVQTDVSMLPGVKNFLALIGKEISIVQDRVGMVLPRILCMLINEAFFAFTEDVAPPRDIDTAMKLGTNYPRGPFEWADEIGLPTVVATLEALHAELGEDRYRIAPLLRQMSRSSTWWGS